MSDSHRYPAPGAQGHSGHAGFSATGIAEVLEAYSTQGGQIFGARRWTQNPLTLTNVRWMGPRSIQQDAVRAPENDAMLDDAELQVWVELAMGFPAMHPNAISSAGAWLPLDVSPQQAAGLAVRLARALSSSQRSGFEPSGPSVHYGTPGPAPFTAAGTSHSNGQLPPAVPPPLPNMPQRQISHAPTPPTYPSGAATPPDSWPRNGQVGAGGPWGATQLANQGVPQGSFARGPIFDDGVSVIPSVEIELPSVGMASVTPAAVRDFTRDAAMTFVRAMKSVPQAREMRGWMRGGRMVLAARLIMAPGAGAATEQERDDAMHVLARTMAQHTLPFARVCIADPGEWSQAQELTEL